jgi:hypothetical protein
MLGRFLFVAIAVVALAISACSGGDSSTPSATATATPSATATPLATNGGIVPQTPTGTPVDTLIFSTASTDNERVVALADSGYTVEGGSISGGVVLQNRNKTEAVVVPYSVTLVYNGSDHPVVTQNVVLLPDQMLGDAFAATYDPPDAKITTVKISVLPSNRWVSFSLPGRLTTTTSSSGGQLTGTVTNPFDQATGPLRLSIIARRADGKIIDGAAQSLESIPAGGSEEFRAGASTSVASVEAHVSFADDLPAWAASP